ncbi:MAG: tyrosine-type recombinase/integrase [Candidatus Brocadia sp.]|nr:MAG: tyrosine-type recombinase/integrase [Candidatus Brocadia sp.]
MKLPKRKAIPTLLEYSKTYLELYKIAKERTLATKKSLINSLVKYLGSYHLDKLTPFVVEKFRIEYKEKDGVKDGTINDCIATLSHLLNTAIKAGIIDNNPCREIKRFKVSQARTRVLATGEITMLLDKLQGKDRLMTLVSVLTGMRLNEVLKLQWQDVDFTKGLITFVQSKTGKLIVVPLSEYLKGELQRYKVTHASNNLFEDRPVTKAVATVASNHFAKLFKQILKDTKVSFHTLRHTFSSIHGDLGTGANTVRELLGHSNLSMTTRYSHSGIEAKIKAVETLTGHILNDKAETVTSKIGTA